MSDARPDPDQLLERVSAEEQRARKGKLKIFFGASAGVGKTYAMLSAARQQVEQGRDVVIGVVETHGRTDTEAMTAGLKRLPAAAIPYRGKSLDEFDLDAALKRHPELILVDELAHSNAPGSRHLKRWHDVAELLSAGINVYTTVNVQHLESLNDVVGGITGIRVTETVPDRVFDEADEVVLVDLPPDELLQRLKTGKVYLAQQAGKAAENFFRKGNLIALRELALRRTADRVDAQMQRYRMDKSVPRVWPARDALLACVGPGADAEKIVRSTARIASLWEAPWHAVYVETPELQRLPEMRRRHVLRALKLAEETGAETATLSAAEAEPALVTYARRHNLGKLVMGRGPAGIKLRFWRRSFADRVGELGADLDVIQIARGAESASTYLPADEGESGRFTAGWSAYVQSLVVCAAMATVAGWLYPLFDLANIVMLFLLAVVISALRYGRGPAALASVVCVGIFDFFFVPPRLSFAVSDVQYLLTFAVMLGVGLFIAHLTAGLKFQATVAMHREERVRAVYEMARDLSGALMPEQIVEICGRFLRAAFEAKAAIVLVDAEGRLSAPLSCGDDAPMVDHGVAQWAFDHAQEAGQGTDTLPGGPVLYLPLKAPMRTRGVLALEIPKGRRALIPEQRRLLDTFSRLIAIALERVHYVEVAQTTTVQIESERLRNSLLSTLSHDLRTPLTALIGLADALTLEHTPAEQDRRAAAEAIRDQAYRINALVDNLLEMARLQSGEIRLNLQWQPLEEVVGSALRILGRALAGHTVTVKLPDDLPLLEFDPVLMERVLSNLLENAVKYTPAGSTITISARVSGEGTPQGRAEILVEDNGPGIVPGMEELIFEKFARGKAESSTSGVGLGLAICRAILRAHHGAIRAENRREGGARFVVSVPLGHPPEVDMEEDVPNEQNYESAPAGTAGKP